MSIRASIQKLLLVTRSKDWRVSFVPFIIGCVYLWLYIFKIPFQSSSLKLFLFSLITTFGFASFGYFINEYFDKTTDIAAGKINKLSLLTQPQQILLFTASFLVTFLPWIWLPSDKISWLLIYLEISLFFLYSLPFPRFKTVPYLSGFIDASYAYFIPLILSFYTYTMYANTSFTPFLSFFSLSVFFIGYRNILIHHVNDIFKDQLSGTVTLPQKIGPKKTNQLIILLLICEVIFTIISSALVAFENSLFFVWIIFYILFIFIRLKQYNFKIRIEYVAVEPVRHLTDLAYQISFPLINLLLLIYMDWRWILLLPFHFVLLIPAFFKDKIFESLVFLWSNFTSHFLYPCRLTFSRIINYPIYYFFLFFGVNLIKENKSAFSYLKSRLRK